MATLKVFISSVMSDLVEERAVVEQAIAEMDLVPNRFEAWSAAPEEPRSRSLAEVADSDIFVLILGSSVSEPVISEYDTARGTIPDRILAFVRKGPRSPEAEEFLTRLREECTYATYRDPRKLGKLMQKAIRSLMRNLLKRRDEPVATVGEDLLVDDQVLLKPGEQYQWELDLNAGDYVNGIVDETDGDPLDVYLMDRQNYVNWKNGEPFDYYGDERTGAWEFQDVSVDEEGRWYLVLRNPVRVYDREVRVELTRQFYK